jgi:hypothetical protein
MNRSYAIDKNRIYRPILKMMNRHSVHTLFTVDMRRRMILTGRYTRGTILGMMALYDDVHRIGDVLAPFQVCESVC